MSLKFKIKQNQYDSTINIKWCDSLINELIKRKINLKNLKDKEGLFIFDYAIKKEKIDLVNFCIDNDFFRMNSVSSDFFMLLDTDDLRVSLSGLFVNDLYNKVFLKKIFEKINDKNKEKAKIILIKILDRVTKYPYLKRNVDLIENEFFFNILTVFLKNATLDYDDNLTQQFIYKLANYNFEIFSTVFSSKLFPDLSLEKLIVIINSHRWLTNKEAMIKNVEKLYLLNSLNLI